MRSEKEKKHVKYKEDKKYESLVRHKGASDLLFPYLIPYPNA